ncbi:MAG: hypothetical protein HKN48_08010 [Flavobacteriaceae bacterium]|nr:hypothetical protein [Flavobacteriaceae bacterium]
MNLTKRFFYYFGGFAIGLVLLYFFVGGAGASCEYDYGPNARTLKNIRLKEHQFSEITRNSLSRHGLDTLAIEQLFRTGDVIFSESNTRLDSCKIYVIEGIVYENELRITVENCDSLATVTAAEIK